MVFGDMSKPDQKAMIYEVGPTMVLSSPNTPAGGTDAGTSTFVSGRSPNVAKYAHYVAPRINTGPALYASLLAGH